MLMRARSLPCPVRASAAAVSPAPNAAPSGPSDSTNARTASRAAARRLGITTRTLYRFVDEGHLPAYRMGRVFRLKQTDVDSFIESSRVEPGTLANLYPERRN